MNGDSFTLGVRPENILITNKETADITVKVELTEQLGSETYLYCKTEGIPLLTVHQSGQYVVSRGELIHLSFDRKFIHLFNVDGKVISSRIKQ